MGESQQGLFGGVLIILVTGIVLGVVHNAMGLAAGGGVTWIGKDAVDAMPSLSDLTSDADAPPDDNPYRTTIDDPMAIFDGGSFLPEIPDLGRPVQIELEMFKKYFDASQVVVVDARDPEEYAASHIEGAVNLPYDQVATDPIPLERFDPGGKAIVTYCGGGSCEMSLQLAEELLFAGKRRVLVYMGGFPEWQEAGYPVASNEG